jgi:hypothetical protein
LRYSEPMSTIESAQSEKRLFPPSGAFVQQAHLDSEGLRVLHDEASADPGAFWLRQAEQLVVADPPDPRAR